MTAARELLTLVLTVVGGREPAFTEEILGMLLGQGEAPRRTPSLVALAAFVRAEGAPLWSTAETLIGTTTVLRLVGGARLET